MSPQRTDAASRRKDADCLCLRALFPCLPCSLLIICHAACSRSKMRARCLRLPPFILLIYDVPILFTQLTYPPSITPANTPPPPPPMLMIN